MYLAYELPPRPVSAVHRDEELCSEVAENGSVISLVTCSGPERALLSDWWGLRGQAHCGSVKDVVR